MESKNSQPGAGDRMRIPVFPIACWLLGVIAFVQLLIAGMALATRFEESRETRIVEKEVTRLVTVRIPTPREPDEHSIVVRPPSPPPQPVAEIPPAPAPTPIQSPAVADPRAERLLTEAREARVAGDMGRAIVKLEEAINQSPEEAPIHYELGLVHEQMGVFDIASAHYETVFRMGVSGAGALYESAAAKLRDGFEQPGDMLGKLSLGRILVFEDPENDDGEQVVLTIPVQKAPGVDVDLDGIDITVRFFNRTSKGEIVERGEDTVVEEQWVSLPFDWQGGEEKLRMNYFIPRAGGQMEHLFGDVRYYGQVVILHYKGEVMDLQARPRDLAARLSHQPSFDPGALPFPDFLGPDVLPLDFDPDIPLLPSR